MDILIGTDPELFIFDSLAERFISSHDLIEGTKQMPFFVENGAYQVDGVAAEFNTFPAKTADEFLTNIRSVESQLLAAIHEKGGTHLSLVAQPTVFFDQEYFASLPRKARMLGCSPDFNAWTESVNSPPKTKLPMRTGAGHIHVGWTSGQDAFDREHVILCQNLVKQLDVAVYPMSLIWDDDRRRQELYGKMGCFRPKHYGVEYRPLSNAYLRDDKIVRWVFETTMLTTELFFNGVCLYEEYPEFQECLNNHNAIWSHHYNLVDKHLLPEFPYPHNMSIEMLERELEIA